MAMLDPAPYKFDPTGKLPANLIQNEQQILTNLNSRDYHMIVPNYAPFFEEGLVLRYYESGQQTPLPLVKGKDWMLTHKFSEASLSTASPVYGSITFLKRDMQGVVAVTYQTLGGDWLIDADAIDKIYLERTQNKRSIYWEEVVELPYRFPVTNHDFNIRDMTGAKELNTSIIDLGEVVKNKVSVKSEVESIKLKLNRLLAREQELDNSKLGSINVHDEADMATGKLFVGTVRRLTAIPDDGYLHTIRIYTEFKNIREMMHFNGLKIFTDSHSPDGNIKMYSDMNTLPQVMDDDLKYMFTIHVLNSDTIICNL